MCTELAVGFLSFWFDVVSFVVLIQGCSVALPTSISHLLNSMPGYPLDVSCSGFGIGPATAVMPKLTNFLAFVGV